MSIAKNLQYARMAKRSQQRMFNPSAPSGTWRWLSFDEASKRLDLAGLFTAQDLRNLADWIDDPKHPCEQSGAMKVVLSKLQ